jgi:hypothetical protein
MALGSCRQIVGFPLAKVRDAAYILFMEPSESQLMQYAPVLMLAAVAVLFSAGTLVASALLGKRARRMAIKDTAYECGMLPSGDGNHQAVGPVLPRGHAVYSF